MAWGMKLNNGFGDYFPDGSFSLWKEQLRQFWYNGLGEERKQIISNSMRSYAGWVSSAFEREIGVEWGGMEVMSPLDEELPKLFQTVKTYRNLASMIKLNDRLIAVDEELCKIIDDLEPGVHRFWPIRIEMPKGVEYPRKYYGMLVGRFLESFMPQKSDPESFKPGELRDDLYTLRGAASENFSGIVFDGSVIGTSHLWRERKLLSIPLFLSDTLKSRIDEANLRLPKCRQIEVAQ